MESRVRSPGAEPVLKKALASLALPILMIGILEFSARGSGGEGAAARPADEKAYVGSDACFLCHRGIVHEMKDLPHAPLMDALKHRGCEECHGPGAAHVESPEKKDLILSLKPGSDPPTANAVCASCHRAAATQAGCFDRLAQGLGPLCASCHRVHLGTGRVAPPAAEAASAAAAAAEGAGEPGDEKRLRSPLKGATAGKEHDLPPVPSPEAKSIEATGEITAGWRFVSGAEPQYQQDVNLDPGPRLLNAEVHGKLLSEGRPFDTFELQASGIDDPFTLYRGKIESLDSWTLTGSYRRYDNVYLSGGDPHSYFVKRDQIDAAASVFLSHETKLSLSYSRIGRSGTAVQSRYVFGNQNDLFQPDDEDVDQVTHVGNLALEFPLGSVFHAIVSQSLTVHLNDDERSFSVPIEDDPFAESETFEEHSRGVIPQTTLRVWGDPVRERLHVEAAATVSHADVKTDIDSVEQGRDVGDSPFSEITEGDARATRDLDALAVSGSYKIADPVTAALRYELQHEDEDGDLDLTEDLSGGTGGGGSTRTIDSTRVRSRTHRVSGDLLVAPVDDVGLRGGYEYYYEHLEVSIDQSPPETRVQGGGPYFGVDVRPSSRLQARAMFHTFDLRNPYTEISPEDDDSASLSVKWKPVDSLTLRGDAKYRVQRSEFVLAVDARDGNFRSETTSAGATATWAATDALDLSASYAYSSIDSNADSVFYFNFEPNFQEAVFDGDSHTGTVDVAWRFIEKTRLTFDAVGVSTGGDYTYQLLDFRLGVAHDLRDDLTLSGEIRRITFDEAARNDNDYTTWVGLVAVTWRF